MKTKKQPLDVEMNWDKDQVIISKTDLEGTILYVNAAFEAVSEYPKAKLVGESHNIIRHPDMPKVVFKKLWEALKKGENYHAIVKNLTKSGRYYWVITDFEIEKDEDGNIVGYTGRKKSISKSIIEKIQPLYKMLLDIEKKRGYEASELYFNAYLKEEVEKEYDDFVLDLFEEKQAEKNKKGRRRGLRALFFPSK